MIITSPNELKSIMKECYNLNLSLFIVGDIGVGKSQIVYQFHQENVGGVFIDERASELDVTDLRGLFRITDEGTEFVPPVQYMQLTKPNAKGTLFLDEFNLASEDVQKIMYRVILDRKIQNYKFSDKVFIVAAGNDISEVKYVNEMSPALINRFVIVYYKPNIDHIIDYLKNKYSIDGPVSAFMTENKTNLIEKINEENLQFTRPRNLEKLLQYIQGKELNKEIENKTFQIMVKAILGPNMGERFLSTLENYEYLNLEKLLSNPKDIAKMERKFLFPLVFKVIGNLELETNNVSTIVKNMKKYNPIIIHIPDSEFYLLYAKDILSKVDRNIKMELFNIFNTDKDFKYIPDILDKIKA